MEIRRAYLAMVKEFPGGADALSGALGLSRDAMENRIYERKGQGVLVDTALQMQAFTGTAHFAEAVSRATGGVHLQLPPGLNLDNVDLGGKFHELYAKLGAFSARYAEATSDNEIDRKEKADLTGLVDEIHQTLAELLFVSFKVFCAKSDQAAGQK